MRLNDAEGNPTGSGFTRTSEDSLSFLDLQPNDLGTTVYETTKFFDPTRSFFYLAKMQQMMVTIKATRLAGLRADSEGPTLNTYFGIDQKLHAQLDAQSKWEFTFQL
jgi:hypothetical protein